MNGQVRQVVITPFDKLTPMGIFLWQVPATHLQAGFGLHHAEDPAERFVGDINLPEGVPLCFQLHFSPKVMLQSKNRS